MSSRAKNKLKDMTVEDIKDKIHSNRFASTVRNALGAVTAKLLNNSVQAKAPSYRMGPGQRTLDQAHRATFKSHRGKKAFDGGPYVKEGRAKHEPKLYQRTRKTDSGKSVKIGQPMTRMRQAYLRRKERQFDRRTGRKSDEAHAS